ncbi:hypothetical protein AUS16_24815 [Escherichia coli]|nr:hypothetical protein AUS16_24815 [Escherichia coli]
MVQFSTGFPVPSFSTPEIFTAIFTPQKSPPEPAGCHHNSVTWLILKRSSPHKVDAPAYHNGLSEDNSVYLVIRTYNRHPR